MSLLSTLTEKPWEHDVSHQIQNTGAEYTRKAGLRVLLVVVSVLFFLFIVAFLMRSQYPDWQPLAEQANQPLADTGQLWINTVYLILASIFLQTSRVFSRRQKINITRASLVSAGVFSFAFVAGQLLFWQQLYQQGFVVNFNAALSFFYLFTGLHAAHIGIGLVAWLVALNAALRGREKAKFYIELCAIYWHFLLALWFVLFALLVSKPETYNAIVEFCGLGVSQ
jgi:cytochrome c oxidase subunit 3